MMQSCRLCQCLRLDLINTSMQKQVVTHQLLTLTLTSDRSLTSDGFKKTAFTKDDTAYISNIITPRSINETPVNVDWQSLDVGLTTSVGISSHLYLFAFKDFDDKPPVIIQGYRVGAKSNDVLSLNVGGNINYLGST